MTQNKDITKAGLKLDPHQVILRPIVTEKGMHNSERRNVYSFEVNPLAGKQAVKKAVELLFDVKVVRVNIQNYKGKPKRTKNIIGKTHSWKKALVKLDTESRINFF
ncbi:MAG: 50S ribosomal protein L23 [Planctomycetaceae bacterium]|jgi:large subunit ribosomal protein L23|nr:50S ribosomal protein L23 [Planctomycetaceae bacterium]